MINIKDLALDPAHEGPIKWSEFEATFMWDVDKLEDTLSSFIHFPAFRRGDQLISLIIWYNRPVHVQRSVTDRLRHSAYCRTFAIRRLLRSVTMEHLYLLQSKSCY